MKVFSLLDIRHRCSLRASNTTFSPSFDFTSCMHSKGWWGKHGITETMTIVCHGTLESALRCSVVHKSFHITLSWKLSVPSTAKADSKHPAAVPAPARHPCPVRLASAVTGHWISSFCLERASSPGSHNATPSHRLNTAPPPSPWRHTPPSPTGCVSAPALPACVTCGARKFARPDFLPFIREWVCVELGSLVRGHRLNQFHPLV